jgi:hypothetical protein
LKNLWAEGICSIKKSCRKFKGCGQGRPGRGTTAVKMSSPGIDSFKAAGRKKREGKWRIPFTYGGEAYEKKKTKEPYCSHESIDNPTR